MVVVWLLQGVKVFLWLKDPIETMSDNPKREGKENLTSIIDFVETTATVVLFVSSNAGSST